MPHPAPAPTPASSAQAPRRLWPWLGGVLLAVAAAVWWFMHHGSPGGAGAASAAASGASGVSGAGGRRFAGAARVQPVSVAVVQRRDVRVTVVAIGNIAAANTAVVRPKVNGELKALYFTEGQAVRAGQVLALIDPRPFEIALAQAQGQLARDQAQWRNAQVDLQRYRDLVAKEAAPRQQADTQEALVAQLLGTVQADQAAVDNAKLQLGYTKVTAPISGLAGLKQADLGNIVHAADANGLLSIAQTQPVNVVFAVPDVHLPRIRQQLQAREPLAVQAWDRNQKVMLAEGRVASTDNAIDTTTGTIRVKALFVNKDNGLFPNQFVNVRLQLDTLAGATAVPSAAVQRGAPGTFVYAVADDGTVSMRRVTVGATDGDWASVQGELQPGEKVVTDGADRLRDGAKVEVIVPQKAGAGYGGAGRRRGGASAPGTGASAAASGAGAWAAREGGAGSAAAAGARTPRSAAVAAEAGDTAPRSQPRATPAQTGAEAAAPADGERPRWMDRVPPEVAEKLKAMSPEERRAWFQKRREQREQQGGN